MARRLIWRFSEGGRSELGAWLDGRIVDSSDKALDWLSPSCSVRLWHPRDSVPDVVLDWRQWLERHPLEEVPSLAFSETMRDVDLFVGVCSVGNDPTWAGGGPEQYAPYWQMYAVGELSESSKTRRAVVEALIPRLKIASRLSLEERFLVVRGDLASYKIHLGSGNVLIEPGSRYLCIVAARGPSFPQKRDFWLPFEGDHGLSVILSKALTLAADTSITDPLILRQIQPTGQAF